VFYGSGFSSYHPDSCHFAFADAGVHFLSEAMSQTVLAALTTRNQGEVVRNDYQCLSVCFLKYSVGKGG